MTAMKKTIIYSSIVAAFISLVASVAGAQTAADVGGQPAANPYFYEKFASYFFIAVVAALTIAVIAALINLLNAMIKMQQMRVYQEQGFEAYEKVVVQQSKESFWKRMYNQWTNVVPVEREEEIMFDHDFDGIRELDNRLPPWWVAMFYITIAFAGIYMVYYHFAGVGPSSIEEYTAQMDVAKKEAAANLAKQANLVDENTVAALTDETALGAGKSIYIASCAACHGQLGEGGVGPNMTDDYWIHGGSIKDLFKTIKYGVPEKGMISWQSQLRPTDMQQVASYILTLRGTNPPNAKEAQGMLYTGEENAAPDTTKAQTTGI
jgi:cytochrome c oxidase cbb3-type subunit 3